MDLKKENIEPQYTIVELTFKEAREFHWHPRTEICYITKGKCDFYVNGEEIRGRAGDILVFQSGDIHRFCAVDEECSTYICTFNPTFLYNRQVKIPAIKKIIRKEELIQYNILHEVISIFSEIFKENNKKENYYEIIVQSQIIKLCTLLVRYFEDGKECEARDIKTFEEFQKILDFISENYADDISLSDVANVVNYSVSNVSLMFHKFVDMNFKKYLNNIRINKSIELMKDQSMNITEVAMRCGFNNVRTFNNVFKSTTDMTPTEMKNKFYQ